LGDANDRHFGPGSDITQSLGELLGYLAVVDQYLYLAFSKISLERRDVTRAWLGIVHHRELKAFIAHGQAERLRHWAEYWLSRRYDRAGMFCLQLSNTLRNTIERVGCPPEALGGVRRVRAVSFGKRSCNGGRHSGHRDRVIPQMGIVTGLAARELRRADLRATRARRCSEQFVHPGVVICAIEDHDLRACKLAHNGGWGF